MSEKSWHEKLLGGFRRTSDKLGENLTGLFTRTTLDRETLDSIEEALIASDLGPATAARVRERLADGRFERGLDADGVRAVVADEIVKVLAPVAEPLEIDAFPRPQVILVIGVNGSGKTTTIAKLAHLFLEQDYGVMLAAGDTNALSQIEIFKEVAGVTGLVMTKLDGTARGGVLVAAAEKFAMPIHAIGVGEGLDDLRPFDPQQLARAIAGAEPVKE